MNDQPAFPLADSNAEYINTDREACNGMTLRDYFAGKCLQNLSGWQQPEEAAARAYEYADAMMKERAK